MADKWFPSSQRCSECGHVGGKKSLGRRSWTCSKCSAHHDRASRQRRQRSKEPQWGPSRPEFTRLET
ncbi:zinc ribbon domain-containing protein [Salinibacter ruber]|uniref:zinc ribbon domain-containing protein n=1 Tax=Salinibacter ruber TaxID=146919 RepID=UPI003C6E77C2